MDYELLKRRVGTACMRNFGCTLADASEKEAYRAVCTAVRELLAERYHAFRRTAGGKQVFYLSMEFLVGPSLRTHLFNLGIGEQMRELLTEAGKDLDALIAAEPDPGLGNGGLGRLAACYLDAAAGLALPCTGFSIKYEYGVFRQKIIGGRQTELPDDWLNDGDVWLSPRRDDSVPVRFGGEAVGRVEEDGIYRVRQYGGETVLAVPCDMYLSGYRSRGVARLTLWEAHSPDAFDMAAFSAGDYAGATERENRAAVISKVLYPADHHPEGKRLRLKQQYFFVSASLQSVVARHLKEGASPDSLPDRIAVHINDTHPALCVPELMRILIDDCGCGWEKAWEISGRVLSYTNHTVMPEALERWSVQLYAELLPRIYQITVEIDRRLKLTLEKLLPGERELRREMAVLADGEVRMANLCLACCHSVNGVSPLHTAILERTLFRGYYRLDGRRFTNVTNGIACRRWLCQANPELTECLISLIGEGFLTDASGLERLMEFRGDVGVLDRLNRIKRRNKQRLSALIAAGTGCGVDPDSLFDVQIKRLHEYKRQLLNLLLILCRYLTLKENPRQELLPRTYLFAAKASPGYERAKRIISLIVGMSQLLASDPVTRDRLRVVFLEDYRVSLAERIIPAADLSEQLSSAGKEASGTGNMKLMLNGAVTIGTEDGANIEILRAVGEENFFRFGLSAEEAERLRREGFDPGEAFRRTPILKEAIGLLRRGINGQRYDDLADSLTAGDPYLTLADFADYRRAQEEVSAAYADRRGFAEKSLVNIAKAGYFSADRAVRQYAERIWGLPGFGGEGERR